MSTQKKYSDMESKILYAIPTDGKQISTLDLVRIVYEGVPPLSARQSVLDCANKLIIKVDLNEEAFEIIRSKARGPNPIYFWKEPRKTENKEDDFFTAEHVRL